ncbi:hypothetical protein HV269_00290 [Citrobacter sp. RHBSTW-00696]|nr:hypothetical protein [Citrobacter sp. RHBSTW-00089]QLU48967.1 hypothetical protein HV269_00290 [Citrobacter sp. RHBSTW-00696]
MVGLAIDQIAQSGLSSLSVIYYSAQLFRDPDITHPYYQGSAIEKINSQQKNIVLTRFSFTAIIKKHNIQKSKRSDMHYTIDNRHRYSEKFIQWVIKNLEQPGWIEESTAHYKKIIKK